MTRIVSPASRADWLEVLASDRDATAQQTPQWCDAVVHSSGGTDVSRLYELEDGRRLILPLVRKQFAPNLFIDGGYLRNYGSGGLLASGGVRGSDVDHVLGDLQGSPAIRTLVRVAPPGADRWQPCRRIPGVIQIGRRAEVLDLSGGFQHIFSKRFQHSARKAVRKAERSRLTVESDSTSRLVPAFYSLYMKWTERRARESGLPRKAALALARRREPLRMFEAVSSLLGDKCRLWIARYEGEPVAGLITLLHEEHATAWRGYSQKEVAGPVRANVLLHRLAIEDAVDSGCLTYSFGQSSGVPSLEQFKKTLGAVPRPSLELRIERVPITDLEMARTRLARRLVDLVQRGRGVDATGSQRPRC